MWRSQPTTANGAVARSLSLQSHASVLTAEGRHTMNQPNTVEPWICSKFHLIQFRVHSLHSFLFGRGRSRKCCVQFECDWICRRWKRERRMRKHCKSHLTAWPVLDDRRSIIHCRRLFFIVCVQWVCDVEMVFLNLVQPMHISHFNQLQSTYKFGVLGIYSTATENPSSQPHDERCHLRWNIRELNYTQIGFELNANWIFVFANCRCIIITNKQFKRCVRAENNQWITALGLLLSSVMPVAKKSIGCRMFSSSRSTRPPAADVYIARKRRSTFATNSPTAHNIRWQNDSQSEIYARTLLAASPCTINASMTHSHK